MNLFMRIHVEVMRAALLTPSWVWLVVVALSASTGWLATQRAPDVEGCVERVVGGYRKEFPDAPEPYLDMWAELSLEACEGLARDGVVRK